jgi:hypothetical protein
MVTQLQFAAVAAYLIWGLVSSLAGVLADGDDYSEAAQTRENFEMPTAR